jgi:hypothetical protein
MIKHISPLHLLEKLILKIKICDGSLEDKSATPVLPHNLWN